VKHILAKRPAIITRFLEVSTVLKTKDVVILQIGQNASILSHFPHTILIGKLGLRNKEQMLVNILS